MQYSKWASLVSRDKHMKMNFLYWYCILYYGLRATDDDDMREKIV